MGYSWSGDDNYGDDSLYVGDLGGNNYGYTTDLDNLSIDDLSGDSGFEDITEDIEGGLTYTDSGEGGETSQDFGINVNYDNFDIDKDYVTEIPNPAREGDTGFGWKYYENGTAISPDGKYYKNGQLVYDPATNSGMLSRLGTAGLGALKSAFTTKNAAGQEVTDWRRVIGAGAGILSGAQRAGLFGNSNRNTRPTGYQGKIPTYQAIRSPVAGAFAAGKAGDPNRQYFSDLVYATPEKAAEAQTATNTQASGIATLQNAADTQRAADLTAAQAAAVPAKQDSATPTNDWQTNMNNAVKVLTAPKVETKLATGGLAGLKKGTYLRGGTDGMADKLRTSIDGGQPAALSHGEFVVPADVVSHLGNGNSDAGAKRLYAMMDKVRQARTGTKKQGKQIDPNKYMPA